MPVSVYHKVAFQVTDQSSAVKESKINSSTKIVADSLKEIDLSKDEEFVSFDVTLLQTNVPDNETKDYCTNLCTRLNIKLHQLLRRLSGKF